ncbi:MAG: MYXO-CTERM sorting domain-containing protein [Myxococcota bacterium]
MFRPALLIAALAIPTTSLAVESGESNSETVVFEGDKRLFSGVEEAYGFGLFDEAVGIYAKVDVSTDMNFVMEGLSDLSWPEILENTWDQTERGGQITLRSKGRIWIELTGEIAGISLGYEIWGEEIDWIETFELRSILLDGTRQGKSVELKARGADVVDIEEEFEVFDKSLIITTRGQIRPLLTATVNAHAIEVGEGAITSTSDRTVIEPPDVNDGFTEFDAVWTGDLAGEMGVEFVPTISVRAGRFSFGPLSYPIDVGVFNDTVQLKSDRSAVNHDLPAARAGSRTVDFGQVTLGEKSTRDFTLSNIGNVELAGTARVEGDGFVMPNETILVARTNGGADTTQTLSIDFLPTAEGTFSGTLILDTNDPVQPEILIPMAGAGATLPEDPGTGDPNDPNGGDVVNLPTSGCGCNSTTPAGSFAAFGLLGLVGLISRRRR